MIDTISLKPPPVLHKLEEATRTVGFQMASDMLTRSLLWTLAASKSGVLSVVDDLLPQPNWPDGHALRVAGLIQNLENRADLRLTKLDWSTGLIRAVKAKTE